MRSASETNTRRITTTESAEDTEIFFVFFSVISVLSVVIIFMFAYGGYRMNHFTHESPLRIAVTQGNYPVMLDPPDDHWKKTFKQYCELSEAAARQTAKEGKPLHLIVWPETVFPYQLIESGGGTVPEEWEDYDSREIPLLMASRWNTPLLLGASTLLFTPEREDRLNSAVLVDPKTQTVGPRYDKVHLVMFGEYVPFAEYLPDNFPLKTLCQTASRGTGPVAIPIPGTDGPAYLSANICFEGLVPHLIRRQITELRRQGKEPEVLVNLSNVGWFFFSSQIDLHLAAQVFRAVENRKPYITAANSGFSASIDANGTILNHGKRREAVSFISEIRPDRRKSFYTTYGDWFAYGCLILTAGLLFHRATNKFGVFNAKSAKSAKKRNLRKKHIFL